MLFLVISIANAEVCVYYFWQYGCSACSRMDTYLNSFEQEYPELKIQKFELHDFNSWQVLMSIDHLYGKDFSVDQMLTPTTFIGDKMIVGAKPDELEGYIIDMLDEGCACPGQDICEPETNETDGNYTNGNGIVPAVIPSDPSITLAFLVTGIVAVAVIVVYYFIRR